MFSWLANAWRVPELRKRVLFTALILALYRLGSWIPPPRVNPHPIQGYFNNNGGGALLGGPARDQALRPRLDHPPAPGRRHPEARGAAEGRGARDGQDQPVHA